MYATSRRFPGLRSGIPYREARSGGLERATDDLAPGLSPADQMSACNELDHQEWSHWPLRQGGPADFHQAASCHLAFMIALLRSGLQCQGMETAMQLPSRLTMPRDAAQQELVVLVVASNDERRVMLYVVSRAAGSGPLPVSKSDLARLPADQ